MNTRRLLVAGAVPLLAVVLSTPCLAQMSDDDALYILANGRRLPYLYAISLADCTGTGKPAHTANAILSRNKVAMDRTGRPAAWRSGKPDS